MKEVLANGLTNQGGLQALLPSMSNLRNLIGLNLFEAPSAPAVHTLQWVVKNISNMVHYFSLVFDYPLMLVISKN